jgi:uncharacterized membrane protein (UPF0127 family)
MTLRVQNRTKGTTVAEHVAVAGGAWSRFWGLMGRKRLEPGRGLLIRPCRSIHMFFMRFPIDAVFLDREGRVVRVVQGVKPWRLAFGGKGAHEVLELNAGAAGEAKVEPGDEIAFLEGGSAQP